MEKGVELVLRAPERRNALTVDDVRGLRAELAAVAPDGGPVLLRAEGDVFCAGADRGVVADPEGVAVLTKELAALVEEIVSAPNPVVARVNGDAWGGGVALAAAADVVIAVDTARFVLPEVRHGLVATIAIAAIQSRGADARFAALTGRPLTAAEAHRQGLVDEVVAADGLDAAVQQVVDDLATGDPAALAATKQLIRRQGDR